MTIQDFTTRYCFKIETATPDNINLHIITKVVRRSDNQVIDKVRTVIEIQETNEWIIDSNMLGSLTQWNWDTFIEETKRTHLDYFAQRIPIDNWYPLDKQSNPNISHLYC